MSERYGIVPIKCFPSIIITYHLIITSRSRKYVQYRLSKDGTFCETFWKAEVRSRTRCPRSRKDED